MHPTTLVLSGRPDIFLGFGTLKKKDPKNGLQKAERKKQGHCYSKREEARLDLIFFRVT